MNEPPPPFQNPPFDSPPPPWPNPPVARLRRSRSDRVGVGLCGGLGRYFGVDPVIFRIVFAVLALFGGSGVLVYLLGWAAIPDEDAADAPLDRLLAGLRRRRVPFGLAVTVGLVLGWVVVFSWWAPNSALPAVVVIGAAVFLVTRRRRGLAESSGPTGPYGAYGPAGAPSPAAPPGPAAAYQPTLAFDGPSPGGYDTPAGSGSTSTAVLPGDSAGPGQLRSWAAESRVRARARRQRSRPLAVSTVLIALAALGGLALLDATRGIRLGTYFWTLGAVVVAGLVVGLISRRTPWSIAVLLIPALAGLVVFGGSHASAHDGWGDRSWQPTSAADLHRDYRLGFGRSTLDLSAVGAVSAPTTVRVRQGAGQARLIIPRTLSTRVVTDVHSGQVTVDGVDRDNGFNFNRVYPSGPATSSSALPVLTIEVSLTAGQITIEHTS